MIPDYKNSAELFRKAALHIQTYGLNRDGNYSDKYDNNRACMIGTLSIVQDRGRDCDGRTIMSLSEKTPEFQILQFIVGGSSIADFSDSHTEQDAIDKFNECVKYCELKESEVKESLLG